MDEQPLAATQRLKTLRKELRDLNDQLTENERQFEDAYDDLARNEELLKHRKHVIELHLATVNDKKMAVDKWMDRKSQLKKARKSGEAAVEKSQRELDALDGEGEKIEARIERRLAEVEGLKKQTF